jgi:hypothetical protein
VRLGPGLSFSWRRALGVSAFKGRIARCTGIPTTRSGLERKVGRTLIHGLLRALVTRQPQSQTFRTLLPLVG